MEYLVALLVIFILLIYGYIYRHIVNLRKENEEREKELEKYRDFSRIDKGIPLKNKIPSVCTDKNVYLIDYENIGTIPKAISEDLDSVSFVFVGNQQKESEQKKRQWIDTGKNFYFINMDKTMHNYLDIFLSCWVGAMISTYAPKSIRIVSKDKGFTAVIEATKVLGFMDIDYLNLQPKTEYRKDFIVKNLKDLLIVSTSKTISMKKFRAFLKKKYTQWTVDDVNAFIDKATELKLIKVRKIDKQFFVDILI